MINLRDPARPLNAISLQLHESTLSAHSTSVAAARINSQPNQLVFRVPPFLTSSLDMFAALLRLLIWWKAYSGGVSRAGYIDVVVF